LIAEGFEANKKLAPFFFKLSKDSEGFIDARKLIKIGTEPSIGKGPSVYLIVLLVSTRRIVPISDFDAKD
jgi:hypothetical protein